LVSVYILYDRDTGEIAHVHVDHGDGEVPYERVARFVAGRLDPERLEVTTATLEELARGIATRVDPATGRVRPAADGEGFGVQVRRGSPVSPPQAPRVYRAARPGGDD
jgi:hypothetical protein